MEIILLAYSLLFSLRLRAEEPPYGNRRAPVRGLNSPRTGDKENKAPQAVDVYEEKDCSNHCLWLEQV